MDVYYIAGAPGGPATPDSILIAPNNQTLLTKSVNPLGTTTELQYATLTNTSIYTLGSGDLSAILLVLLLTLLLLPLLRNTSSVTAAVSLL